MAIVEVDKLTKRYKGAATNAVDGISFAIEPGEFFTLLGPNGAGKTTTISILTTTLAPTTGTVRVAGFDLATQASQVRRQVGIIFQRPSLGTFVFPLIFIGALGGSLQASFGRSSDFNLLVFTFTGVFAQTLTFRPPPSASSRCSRIARTT